MAMSRLKSTLEMLSEINLVLLDESDPRIKQDGMASVQMRENSASEPVRIWFNLDDAKEIAENLKKMHFDGAHLSQVFLYSRASKKIYNSWVKKGGNSVLQFTWNDQKDKSGDVVLLKDII